MSNSNNIRGSILIRPIQAKLYRDVELFKKMDPYVMITIGNVSLKGTVCKNGGKAPKWNDIIAFGVKDSATTAVIELMDKDMFTSDDIIGVAELDLAEAERAEKHLKWYELLFKGRLAGELLIETIFVSDQYLDAPLLYVDNKRVESQSILGHNARKYANKHIRNIRERGSVGKKIEELESHVIDKIIGGIEDADKMEENKKRERIESMRGEFRMVKKEREEVEYEKLPGDASLLTRSILENSSYEA